MTNHINFKNLRLPSYRISFFLLILVLSYGVGTHSFQSNFRISMYDQYEKDSKVIAASGEIRDYFSSQLSTENGCIDTAIITSNFDNSTLILRYINKIGDSSYEPINVTRVSIASVDQSYIHPTIVFSNNSVIKSFILSSSIIEKTLRIDYNCDYDKINNENLRGWGYIRLIIETEKGSIPIEYIKECSLINIHTFDYSYIIIGLIGFFTIILSSIQQRTIYETVATRLITGIVWVEIGFFCVFIAVYNIMLLSTMELIYIVGFAWFVMISRISYIIKKIIKKIAKKLKRVINRDFTHNITTFISIIITFWLMSIWIEYKSWIITNIICITIVLFSTKFLKITSIKIALIVVIISLALSFGIRLILGEWQSGRDIILPMQIPLMIEMPFFDYFSYPDCAKLGCDSILLPSILAAFAYRVDTFFNLNVYWKYSLIGYFFGAILSELYMVLFNTFDTQLFFTLPCMILMILLVGIKRKELKLLWLGTSKNTLEESKKILQVSEVKKTSETNNFELTSTVKFDKLQEHEEKDLSPREKHDEFDKVIQSDERIIIKNQIDEYKFDNHYLPSKIHNAY